MMNEKNQMKYPVLQRFQLGIDFLMHNSYLRVLINKKTKNRKDEAHLQRFNHYIRLTNMSETKAKILIIDDDRTVCTSLQFLLKKKQYETQAIHHPAIAQETIESFDPKLILLDMNFTIDTSGKQGLKLLKIIREEFPNISVILMTGWATVQLAVEGMKIGAKDFMAKPWDNKDLMSSIESILSLHHEQSIKRSTAIKVAHNDYNIIGNSEEMKQVMDLVNRVAATEASVLITGESGTGKELVAEAIHNQSHRATQEFVKVNLGGIPSELFESEMFGHKKGAFTGAYDDREGRFTKANKGTIFLDEIGELPLNNQVKMLRVLQERTFEPLGSSNTTKINVRVISATNRDLALMANTGDFREDLYYRINLLNIHLPPLRDRRSDIPALVKHFIKSIADLYDAGIPYIDDETFKWISQQEYKGNIRQLKNITERTFLLNMKKKDLTIKDFMPCFNFPSQSVEKTSELNLQEMEIQTIKKALAKHNHSISSASRALGITRSSLYRRLEKYGIPHEPKI